MPDFIPVDAQVEQDKAISGNLAATPKLMDLAGQWNKFNLNELNERLGTTDPFKDQIATQLSKNRLDWSKGVMSDDLADQVQNLTAARAVGGGFGGSGAHNNLLARNYGLTSLALQEKAQSSEESWLRTAASIYQPGMFDISNMMVTPAQQIALSVEERNAKFQRDYVENQWKWYNSGAQRFGRFEDQFEQIMASVAGIMGGMASQGAMACWVARECFGETNPKWVLFRHWMLVKSPRWFRNLYLKHGQKFARWIHGKTKLKSLIRVWMESRIKTLEVPLGLI